MASTNKTTNLELSQFLGTDKPAWLTDYNSDMQKIDVGFKKQSDDIDVLDGRTTDLESGLGNSNTEIVTVKNDVQSLKDEDVIIKRDINTLATNYDTIHHEVAVNTQTIEDVKLKNTQQDEEIQGIKNNYLPLNGGNMKGPIALKQNGLTMVTNYAREEEFTSNRYTDLEVKDKNDKRLFTIGSGQYLDGSYAINCNVYKQQEENEYIGFVFKSASNGDVTFTLSASPVASSSGKEVVTAEWVRNLLVKLGISGASTAQLDNTESEGSV